MTVWNDAALARVLGLSKAAVSRAKKRGMPTDCADAARAWRDKNLNPALRKDVNTYSKAASGYAGSVVDPRARIERVRALMELADAAIDTRTFEALREPLCQAMRDVPADHRASVLLSAKVMDALLGDFPSMLITSMLSDPPAATPASANSPAPAVGGTSMSDHEAEVMGAFWYAMACREPFPADLLTAGAAV